MHHCWCCFLLLLLLVVWVDSHLVTLLELCVLLLQLFMECAVCLVQ